MWVIESANIFKGYYHILGGNINSSEKNDNKKFINRLFDKKNKKQ